MALLGQIHVDTVGFFQHYVIKFMFCCSDDLTHKNIAPAKGQQKGVYFFFLFYVILFVLNIKSFRLHVRPVDLNAER